MKALPKLRRRHSNERYLQSTLPHRSQAGSEAQRRWSSDVCRRLQTSEPPRYSSSPTAPACSAGVGPMQQTTDFVAVPTTARGGDRMRRMPVCKVKSLAATVVA